MRKARKKGLLLPAHLFSPDTAQSTLEYAVIIVCLVAALLAMSVYLKRSVQGNLRKSADQLGEQYEPRETTGSFTTTYSNKNVNTVNTTSEKQYNHDHGTNIDFNGNGLTNDTNVFVTEATNELKRSNTEQSGSETVRGYNN